MANYQPKILVVDDDDAVRMTLAEILEDEGFDVSNASDGLQGIQMATQGHFDLIFMDVRMPGINGMEAFRKIKMVSPASIVIMITAYSDGLIEQALAEGVYAVLYKPFNLRQLSEIVRSTLKTTCVLVVDDHPETRETLRDILEDSGYQVSEAVDGKQAVTKAGQKHYDIILMDAVMPGMGGFAACEKIIEEDPNAKIIFLTAHSVVDWVRQALAAGAFSMLRKPMEPEDMLSLMRSVVEDDATETKDPAD